MQPKEKQEYFETLLQLVEENSENPELDDISKSFSLEDLEIKINKALSLIKKEMQDLGFNPPSDKKILMMWIFLHETADYSYGEDITFRS